MYGYPEPTGPDADLLAAGPLTEIAQAAEAAGFGGFAFTEHPAPPARWLREGGHQTLDPFVALGHVAAVTRELRLLTYLTVAPYRNPLLLGKAAATLDVLSGGRFVLGLGAGYLKAEFRALGVDFDERNALVDEALEVLPMYWSGEPFSYRGRHFECREVLARPRPLAGTIPIWIGGNSALTRRRVAERGHGWMPLTGPAQLFATTRTPALDVDSGLAPAIRALRDDAGDRGPAIEVLVAHADPALGEPDHDLGSLRARFADYEAAGVNWVAVPGPPRNREESLRFLERFGRACIAN
jgi:probable F420-dependent oxidoreductase